MKSPSTKPYSVVAHLPRTTELCSGALLPEVSVRSFSALSYSACEMTPRSRIRRSDMSSMGERGAAAAGTTGGAPDGGGEIGAGVEGALADEGRGGAGTGAGTGAG